MSSYFIAFSAVVLISHFSAVADEKRRADLHPIGFEKVLEVVKDLSDMTVLSYEAVERTLGATGQLQLKSKTEFVAFYEEKAPVSGWRKIDLRIPLPTNKTFKGFVVLKSDSAIQVDKAEITRIFPGPISERAHVIFDHPKTDETVLSFQARGAKISLVVNKDHILQFVAIDRN